MVKILIGFCEKYEVYYNCKYIMEVIDVVVYFLLWYIADRFFSDKVIDFIDEAGSRVRI